MSNAGPAVCGMGTDGGNGFVVWGNPDRIQISDALFAIALLSAANPLSNEIIGSNFAFAIPSDASIMGIQVDFNRKKGGIGSAVHDNDVTLRKAGVSVGENKATADAWTTVSTQASYGGANDLWSTTWLPSDINDVNFGVQVSAIQTAASPSAQIDYVQITVTYSNASGIYQIGCKQWRTRMTPGMGN